MKQLQLNKSKMINAILALLTTTHAGSCLAATGFGAAVQTPFQFNRPGILEMQHVGYYICKYRLNNTDIAQCPNILKVNDGVLNQSTIIFTRTATTYELTGQVTDQEKKRKNRTVINIPEQTVKLLYLNTGSSDGTSRGLIRNETAITGTHGVYIHTDEPNGTKNSFSIKYIPMLYVPNDVDLDNFLPGRPYTQTFEYVVHNKKAYPVDYTYNPCSTNENEISINHGTISPKNSNNSTALANINITCEYEVSATLTINNTTSNDPETTVHLQPDGNTALAMAIAGDELWGTRIEKTLPTGTSTVNIKSTLSRNNEPGIKNGHAVLSMTFN
ncbi:hypothetical protein D3W91_25715 [Salmonella enterica]|nr:hypothetical protein [Salmonella enterica]